MSFLNGVLLYGSILCALPWLIHLLARRYYQHMPWAATAILLRAVNRNRSMLRRREIVLIVLRCLILLFVTLALARPTLQQTPKLPGTKKRKAAVVLLDNSYSMQFQEGQESRLELGKRHARQILEQLAKGTWVSLKTFHVQPQIVHGEPSRNLEGILHDLNALVGPSAFPTDLLSALKDTLNLIQEHPELRASENECYLLTDLQAYPWQEPADHEALKNILIELSRIATLYIIDCASESIENVAIDNFQPQDPVVLADSDVLFAIHITNYGNYPAVGIPLELYLEQPAQSSTQPVFRTSLTLPPKTSTVVHWPIQIRSAGEFKALAQIGNDRLLADNRRYFVLSPVELSRILIVDARQRGFAYADSATVIYIEAALRSAFGHIRNLKIDFATPSSLDSSQLADCRCLILLGTEGIGPEFIVNLKEQLAAGLGVIVFPGSAPEHERFDLLFEHGIWPKFEGLRQWSNEGGTAGLWSADEQALVHPVMQRFNTSDMRELLGSIRQYKACRLAPSPEFKAVARFADGSTAVFERILGSGCLYGSSFALEKTWTNLPFEPIFPILIQRLAIGAVGGGAQSSRNLIVGERILTHQTLLDRRTSVLVTVPDRPLQQELETLETADGVTGYYTYYTNDSGVYTVKSDRPGTATQWFAANLNTRQESNLEKISPEALRALFPEVTFHFLHSQADLIAGIRKVRQGSELWPFFLMLASILTFVELYLGRRWATRFN